MPKLFISYARTDLDAVKKIELALVQSDIKVWRDQESLYGGQQWPKALGEAIASHDFFLLVWSKTSAKSHFVEFEWNTALALKKTIIPCMLDDTPLSSSLSAINAIFLEDFSEGLSQILKALRKPIRQTSPQQVTKVIEKLGQVTATEPKKVAKAAKSIFVQEGWNVQGNIYQAGGDVNIRVYQTPAMKTKSLLEKWQVRVGLIVALLTVLTLTLQIPEKIKEVIHTMKPTPTSCRFHGSVMDSAGNPVSEAKLIIEGKKGEGITSQSGDFSFEVKVPEGQVVRLRVEKDGHIGYDDYVTLPGPVSILFK